MESLKVKDYMTLQAVTFKPEMSLSAALEKMLKSSYLGGPVINEREEVIGFLSGHDLLDKLVKVSYYCQDTHIVSDCMHSKVLAVGPDTSIIELADMMKSGKPKVYPVIDNGRLVGIITRRDVLRAVAKNLDDCFKHPV
ncbi:CBS domain-containing protein [Vibrio pectenicida]|uniref:CBS domain-containing protein n=1 Tax=Vibrio pectenicida TaxID=62763 RepID=A0A3R9E124_9VIBR|nr:CBS domain-containing protein [Vibrio pectenicida]NOH70260.1 CBS domain-containing protein [Vibrio pectenicida]RSD31905.1 CBS domain-containing protein [Vibrio pectenicida]